MTLDEKFKIFIAVRMAWDDMQDSWGEQAHGRFIALYGLLVDLGLDEEYNAVYYPTGNTPKYEGGWVYRRCE